MRWAAVLGVLAAAAVGLSVMIGSAAGQGNGKSAAAVATVTVTLGKPSEFSFRLSKTDGIPVGKVMFKVTNLGVIDHDFKLCKALFTAKALANACAVAGGTKMLKKGQSQTFTLTLKKGTYEILCTLSGHAKNGMKGLLGVGVQLAGGAHKLVVTTTGPAQPPGPQQQAGQCASPVPSTITPAMADYAFSGVPRTIPCGPVTVVASNVGTDYHNFSFVTKAPGDIVPGGQMATQTVFLEAGVYTYRCDVGDHAAIGQSGTITVL